METKIMKIIDFFTHKEILLTNKVNMYLCGPTTYNSPHIGNMRPIIIFDILNRVLSLELEVNFVHNITDVDDKIINKAIQERKTEKEISHKYELEYLDLLKKLSIIMPNNMPRVTDNISGIIKFINNLILKGNAYEINGTVYFDVDSFSEYSKYFSISGNISNEIFIEKRNQKDFALWKKTKKGITWSSPWGNGRPGWHTECAYFILNSFGYNGIDIHGGGIDLKFPHHINEQAQYQAYTGNIMSKSWLYVGHVTIDDEKMSKSSGNFITANKFINLYSANTLRLIMILTNIQKPININKNIITNAENLLMKIKNTILKTLIDISMNTEKDLSEVDPSLEFVEHLKNNLNFSSAITFLLKQIKILNSDIEINRKAKIIEELIANLKILGIFFNIKYNKMKVDIKKSKNEMNFSELDNFKSEMIN